MTAFMVVRIEGRDRCAPLEVLRRRSYLCALPLPFNRYLIVGWMNL